MRLATALLFVLLVAACSSSDSDVTTATSIDTSAAESTTTAAQAASTGGGSNELELTRRVSYSTTSLNSLDVYSPGGSGPWPVLLIVHGSSQSKEPFTPLAKAIAAEGAVVFNVTASMFPPFDAALEEVACSVGLANASAADYGGDPSRITLVGSSAGATIGLVVAMAEGDLSPNCVADGSVQIDGVVAYEGPYDYATTLYRPDGLASYKSTEPDLVAAADPYSHLGGNPDLVVRLIHGDDSDVAWYEIPRSVSVDFHQALVEAGYDADLTLVDDSSHTGLTSTSQEAFAIAVDLALETARG